MKKTTLWAGIIGLVLVLTFLIAAAYSISNPTEILRVNIANVVTDIAAAGVGIFLIIIFLKNRKAEEAGLVGIKHEPNSPEDKESLGRRRNWIFGFVMLFEIVFSLGSYILNRYTAGLTLINISIIFDLVMNIVFLFVVIQLFRNKKSILTPFLFLIILYTVVESVLSWMRGDWAGAVSGILLGFYFMYAIFAPLNRKNHRIAHLIILPAVIILGIVLVIIGNAKVTQMSKNEATLEQVYGAANDDLTSQYSSLLEKQSPFPADIQNVQTSVNNREQALQNDISAIHALETVYEGQLPSTSQEIALERYQKLLNILDLDHQQGVEVGKFMTYLGTIDFSNYLSDVQRIQIDTYIQAVQSFNKQIEAADITLKTN